MKDESKAWKQALALFVLVALLGCIILGKVLAVDGTITLQGNKFSTIVSNTTEGTVTVSGYGYVSNAGNKKTFLSAPEISVATTDAQAEGIIGLSPGDTQPINGSFRHKTASGSTVIYWTQSR